LIKNRTDKKLFPWTFFGFLKSAFASCFFIAGAALMIPVGLILVKFNPFNKEKGKFIFHVLISRISRLLIYTMWNVKKTISNSYNEDFSKPAVIVCNHQSGIDNFLLMMLHPKLILFTNDRVWNAPVSGIVVKMADYYSTANGVENSLALLEDRVKNGYSIVVFAEGTRSPDGNVQRFHKGAFYLAEKLNLDILPIILHGSGDTLTKNDFLVKDGKITLKFLSRIKPDDESYGKGYSERGKMIGRYFRAAYNQLRVELEQPAYFREQLIYNYIYKGPVLEWYMKVKTSLEKNYEPFHELLPREGKMLDIGCGYGFMSYMLHFAARGRHITGIDYDEEKTETANNCFSKDANISFKFADVLNFPFEDYDAIIIADMLHYLEPMQQREIIEKCIRHLNAGGILIIRDGNKELEEKHKGTRLTEFFSTKLIGFNKTTAKGLSFLSGSLIREIAAAHQLECREIDQTKYTSNMMFIIKKPE